MNTKIDGPFKRQKSKQSSNNSIHKPLISIFLGLIALSQLPIALKSTLDVVCIAKRVNTENASSNWCK